MNKRIEMNLNDREWREFIFDDVFQIDSTSSGIDKNKLVVKKGNFPYVTRTDKNNGIDFFVCEQEIRYKKDTQNVITIGLDTQTVFYQPNEFYTGQNIQILSNEKLNYFNAQFFIPLIKKQMEKFSWGSNGATLTRLKRSKLVLPSDKNNKPDYAFMEQFMRVKKQEKLEQYDNYIQKRLNESKDYKEVKSFNEKEWREFDLKEIFTNIQRGKRLKKDEHKTGKMPYTSSSAVNNGIDGFISNKDKVRIFRKCLSIANSGSVGATFYQHFSFVASDHVTKLQNEQFNRYIYLFISSIIKRLSEKYSFNREINDKRIQREKIVLPINKKGEPDYEYMENYIKKIEFEKLNQYLPMKTK